MSVLTAFVLFAIAFAVHIAFWKIHVPKRQIPVLLIFFAVAFVSWLLCAIARSDPLIAVLRAGLLYVSISLCYVITYSAIEGGSPTLSLMEFIAQNGDSGRSAEEISGFLSQHSFAQRRLKSLIESGLVREVDGAYSIVGNGSRAFRLILAYRKLYGHIPKGG